MDESIELSILPGTTFLAPSPDLQTMVVRHQMYIFLDEKDEVTLEVDVACANMRLEAPSGGESYIVKIEPPAEELRKLMGLPEFQDAPSACSNLLSGQSPIIPQKASMLARYGWCRQPALEHRVADDCHLVREAAGLTLGDYPALK